MAAGSGARRLTPSDYDLAAPGYRTGNGFADLIARHRTTGELRLLEGTGPSGEGLGDPAAGTSLASGWSSTQRPLLTAVPDANGDGRPDLWATTNMGGLLFLGNLTGDGVQVGTGGWQVFSQLS
ncbi:hypothetical protein ACFXDJ_02600 [Streptomyces sp. NPDC059443]|uniref:hypothetical protein n=1 Tax=unclassified Streptomyces TaxID=2593676 RepID=UPI0036BB1238